MNKIAKELKRILKEDVSHLIEVPKNPDMGDYALPCFTLATKMKKNPGEIAKEIAGKVKGLQAKAVGPYVNFFIDKKEVARKLIKKIEKGEFGSGNNKKRIMVEFSQPNTHKAFHVGHIRGTSLGESLARIMEFSGNKVIRVNYSGDTGMHIAKWLWCYKKYHPREKLKSDEGWIAGIYVDAVKRLKNERFQEEVEEINRKLDSREDKRLNDLWKETRKLSIDSWKKIYKELDTRFDKHYFESSMEAPGKKISLDLEKKGLAKLSDEAVIMDLKEYGLSVWVLLRRDGTVLYSAKDLALAEKKFRDYKLDGSLVITDQSQDLHFKQLQKTLALMKFGKEYGHASYGSIRLPWGKMSSRTGDNILYSDFRDEIVSLASREVKKRYKGLSKKEIERRALAISIAAIKYAFLKQDVNKVIVFNKKDAMRFDGDTGPYLLYSYARALSILKKGGKKDSKIGELEESEERLVMALDRFPDIVKEAYEDYSPSLVARYAYDISKSFSDFYHNCQVIGSDSEGFRLKLVDAFTKVLGKCLDLLGIEKLKEM